MSCLNKSKKPSQDLTTSILADEKSFYHIFTQDLCEARQEVIIESPFITVPRLATLKPLLEQLIKKGVEVFIVNRYPRLKPWYFKTYYKVSLS